ncbi:MAG: hypothetical protein GY757_35625, partial [bacterium]|nr:hypothetical protein [bacterium]
NKEQDFSGGLDNLTVSVGLNPLKWINIGVSVNFWMNGYEGETQEYHWGEYSGDIDATDIREFYKRERISLDIKGYNFNVGILVKPFKNFKIGMVYKSSFSADITYDYLLGEGNSVGAGGEEEEEEEEDRSSIAGTSRLQWPTTWGMGLSYQPIDQLTVSADFTFTQWSKGIMKNFPDFETYDPTTQSVEYIDMFFPMMRPVKSLEDLENPSKQLDTKQFRFGIEYVLIGKKVLIPLRLGFFTDAQYFMDCTGEEVNFTGITGGFGVKKGGLSLDFAVLLEIGSYLRDVDDYSTTSYTEMKAFMSTSFSF